METNSEGAKGSPVEPPKQGKNGKNRKYRQKEEKKFCRIQGESVSPIHLSVHPSVHLFGYHAMTGICEARASLWKV